MRSRVYPLLFRVLATLALLATIAIPPASALAQGTCQTVITVDVPTAGSTFAGNGTAGGWAVDRASASGSNSGIQEVLIYRDAAVGAVYLGQATKAARPDVDALFGLSGAQTGWVLNVDYGAMPPGNHTVDVYVHAACGWYLTSVPIVVSSVGAEISIDLPPSGQSVALGQRIDVGGWAANAAGPGTGVDQVQVLRDGQMGSGGTVLGNATYGKPRPDVAAAKGRPEWANSGYDYVWTVGGVSPGPHTIYVYARSTSTGQWGFKTVDITVTGAQAGTGGQYNQGYGRGYSNCDPYSMSSYGSPYSSGYGYPYSGSSGYGYPYSGSSGYGYPYSGSSGYGYPYSGSSGYGYPYSGSSGYGYGNPCYGGYGQQYQQYPPGYGTPYPPGYIPGIPYSYPYGLGYGNGIGYACGNLTYSQPGFSQVGIYDGQAGQPGVYTPATVSVRVGDTVSWTNCGPASQHSSTSVTGLWDSGPLRPGQSFSFRFTTVGTFSYHDTITGQNGTITVN